MLKKMVKCTLCDNEYSSYVCMWRHRKLKHLNIIISINIIGIEANCNLCKNGKVDQ